MSQLDFLATLDPVKADPALDGAEFEYRVGGPAWSYYEGTEAADYSEGHPWHYLMGGIALKEDTIKLTEYWAHIGKRPKRGPKLDEVIRQTQAELAKCLRDYHDLCFGSNPRRFERRDPNWPGLLGHCQSMSLCRNHIFYYRAQLWWYKWYRHYQIT